MGKPYIAGDTFSIVNCSATLSTSKYYGGAKSLRIKKTAASTAEYRFCDNITKTDLHGLYPGHEYVLSGYAYLLTTGSPTTAEVKFVIGYTTKSTGTWTEKVGTPSTLKDSWNVCQTTAVLLPASAVGAKILIRINGGASTDEIIHVDNIRLQPKGTHNLHTQNFYDAGSNTYYGL